MKYVNVRRYHIYITDKSIVYTGFRVIQFFLHVSNHCAGVCHLLYMSIIFRSLLFGRKGVNFDRCKRVCGRCEMYYYTSLVNRKFHKWIFISNIVVRSLSFMSYLSWTSLRIKPKVVFLHKINLKLIKSYYK